MLKLIIMLFLPKQNFKQAYVISTKSEQMIDVQILWSCLFIQTIGPKASARKNSAHDALGYDFLNDTVKTKSMMPTGN